MVGVEPSLALEPAAPDPVGQAGPADDDLLDRPRGQLAQELVHALEGQLLALEQQVGHQAAHHPPHEQDLALVPCVEVSQIVHL